MLSIVPEALAGRGRELELIRSFLGGAAVDGAALLLWGKPGAGKTALLDAAAEAASASGHHGLHSASSAPASFCTSAQGCAGRSS
jgi:Cdc6-like AAA superfamily ATPase